MFLSSKKANQKSDEREETRFENEIQKKESSVQTNSEQIKSLNHLVSVHLFQGIPILKQRMVRNFNELVLKQARTEDRIASIGKLKAKEILDEKREKQVGLSRSEHLFSPITTRLDIAQKTREKEEGEEVKKKKKEEMKQIVIDALAGVERPGLGEKDVEEFERMIEKAIGATTPGVSEKALGEMLDKSFQDVKEQVEAKSGGISEERLEEINAKQREELKQMIGGIPAGLSKGEIKDILDESTKDVKDAIAAIPGGVSEEKIKKILEKHVENILKKLEDLEKFKQLEGAVGGVPPKTDDASFSEEFKFTPPSTPSGSASQPLTSTPAAVSFDHGSLLQTPQAQESGEETEFEDHPESVVGDTTAGEETEAEYATATEETEAEDVSASEIEGEKEKEKHYLDAISKLNKQLSRDSAKRNIAAGRPPMAEGNFGGLPNDFLAKVRKEFEVEKGGRTFKSIIKDYGYVNIVVAKGPKKENTRFWMKVEDYDKEYGHLDESKRPKTGKRREKKTGSGLNDSLTESERLKVFAIVKRNIGSINAGNTSKQSVKQTIDAIKLLSFSGEITKGQEISLLKKLKSAINK